MRTFDRIRRSSLLRNRRGIAMVELALGLPCFLVLLLYGAELTNYAIVRQRISQLALQVADNGSRIGTQERLSNRSISEQQINDLFTGAQLQSGSSDIQSNGRIIMSSLELNGEGGQWIHWQRCFGAMNHPSTYGNEDVGKHGKAFPGMGPSGSLVTGVAGDPTIFVEIAYTYKPVISSLLAPGGTIVEVAALSVRDDRDTDKIDNDEHVTVSRCQ